MGSLNSACSEEHRSRSLPVPLRLRDRAAQTPPLILLSQAGRGADLVNCWVRGTPVQPIGWDCGSVWPLLGECLQPSIGESQPGVGD
jgi:hypothetical protein